MQILLKVCVAQHIKDVAEGYGLASYKPCLAITILLGVRCGLHGDCMLMADLAEWPGPAGGGIPEVHTFDHLQQGEVVCNKSCIFALKLQPSRPYVQEAKPH